MKPGLRGCVCKPLVETSERTMAGLLIAPDQGGGKLQGIKGPQAVPFGQGFSYIPQALAWLNFKPQTAKAVLLCQSVLQFRLFQVAGPY